MSVNSAAVASSTSVPVRLLSSIKGNLSRYSIKAAWLFWLGRGGGAVRFSPGQTTSARLHNTSDFLTFPLSNTFTFLLRRKPNASTSKRECHRVAAREGARQSAPALRARRHSAHHDPAARRRRESFQPQYAPALAGQPGRQGRLVQRGRRRPRSRLRHGLRCRAGFADFLPLRD